MNAPPMTWFDWTVLVGAFVLLVWHVWFVTIKLPRELAKMTPEEREKFLKEWEEAGRYER